MRQYKAYMSVIAGLTAINQTPLGEHKPGSNNKAKAEPTHAANKLKQRQKSPTAGSRLELLGMNISDDRVSRFHKGQIWESPRGILYRVIDVAKGGKATLCKDNDGSARNIKRDWDSVINWVLHRDS